MSLLFVTPIPVATLVAFLLRSTCSRCIPPQCFLWGAAGGDCAACPPVCWAPVHYLPTILTTLVPGLDNYPGACLSTLCAGLALMNPGGLGAGGCHLRYSARYRSSGVGTGQRRGRLMSGAALADAPFLTSYSLQSISLLPGHISGHLWTWVPQA